MGFLGSLGGIGGALGHAAAGYVQSAQLDQQRQFQDEQSRRQQMIEMMGKLAADETVHPEVRSWAVQQGLMGTKAPYKQGKPWQPQWDTMPVRPATPPQTATTPGISALPTPPAGLPIANFGPPPAQAGISPLPTGPTATPPAGLSGAPSMTLSNLPPVPPGLLDRGPQTVSTPGQSAGGIFMTPEEHTAQLAARTGSVTGAQERGQLQAKVDVMGPAIQKILQDNPQYKDDPIVGPALAAASVGVQLPFGVYKAGMAGKTTNDTVANALANPEWAHLVPDALKNDPNHTVQLVRDNAGRPMSVTSEILPSLVPKTTDSTVTSPGGLPTTTHKTTTPKLGAPPAPPSGVQQNSTSGSPKARLIAPAVAAAMDNIMMYGLPEGKTNDAQALALAEMKKEGIDPQIAATMATRTMGDKGRAIIPLIAKARELIAQDPTALGPLSGRWSEIQNKAGNLHGAAKELAGTLVSIYSIAGGMHGWRALKVADEFKNTYGDLSNDPASLNRGLDSMLNTANTIIHTAYPGAPPTGTQNTPEKTQAPFNINHYPTIQSNHG